MIMPILSVRDVDASSRFYREKLGFSEGVRMPAQDGSASFAIVDKGETAHIGLTRDPDQSGEGRGVLLMVYVPQETDMEAYYAAVQEKGAPITEELKTEYWGDQLFTVTDPDGYVLSLCKTVKQMSADEIIASQPGS